MPSIIHVVLASLNALIIAVNFITQINRYDCVCVLHFFTNVKSCPHERCLLNIKVIFRFWRTVQWYRQQSLWFFLCTLCKAPTQELGIMSDPNDYISLFVQYSGDSYLWSSYKANVECVCCLVGDPGVGKTSILLRYLRNQFSPLYIPTKKVAIGMYNTCINFTKRNCH